jgi:DeoR/GlpR family transcriptional regulator of sugar metabolism
MSISLFRTERQKEIVSRIQESGRVAVSDLAAHFQVSDVTIRGDLQDLAERNLILRTHGGAICTNRGLQELSLADRRRQQVAEKDRIGAAGAAMVSDNEAIILDCSSTSLAVARHLKRHLHLTVLTNSLAIAYELTDSPGIHVLMPGGSLRRDMGSIIGGYGLEAFQGFHIQKGFFGAFGISITEGLTDSSLEESELRRKLVKMSRQVIAVVDHTKWGRVGLASSAAIKDLHTIITDRKAPADMINKAKDLAVQVQLV